MGLTTGPARLVGMHGECSLEQGVPLAGDLGVLERWELLVPVITPGAALRSCQLAMGLTVGLSYIFVSSVASAPGLGGHSAENLGFYAIQFG